MSKRHEHGEVGQTGKRVNYRLDYCRRNQVLDVESRAWGWHLWIGQPYGPDEVYIGEFRTKRLAYARLTAEATA